MVRKFTKDMTEEVMGIWIRENKNAHPFIPPSYWEGYYNDVKNQLPETELYTFEEFGDIKGFIGLSGSYIEGLFVKKESRRLGIGSLLLNHVKERHHKLSLRVYVKNQEAAAFYQTQGFWIRETGLHEATSEEEYQMEWEQGRQGN